jgi:hypothetical protein
MSKVRHDFTLPIQIKISGRNKTIEAQIMTSDVISVLGVSDISKRNFKIPRLIRFNNPNTQNLIIFNQLFNVEILCIEGYDGGKVSKIHYIKRHAATGRYIQAFAQINAIIIVPEGFVRETKIIEGKTKINIIN